MDALRVAAPLARLLLALGESGREGELVVAGPPEPRGRARTAQLSVARGRLLALRGVEVRPLGDTLLALGEMASSWQHGLLRQDDGTRVGARLVAAGATSAAAVQRALELQLAQGLDGLLRWPAGKLELRKCASAVPSGACFASLDLVGAVWSTLLALAGSLPVATLARLSGSGSLALRGNGARRAKSLVHAAESGALRQSSARLAASAGPALELELSAESLRRALASPESRTDHVLRAVLRVLGSAVECPGPEASYALLLRKTRELARNASAHVLLDLPTQASSAHARIALRRLAQKLHPDRFHAGDARLYAVSNRVMGALAEAEQSLRAACSA